MYLTDGCKQVLLRWGIQRGTSVIPKATSPERIRENFGALSFELSAQQMEQLSTLAYQARLLRLMIRAWVSESCMKRFGPRSQLAP